MSNDITFKLVNEDAVERLLKDGDIKLPYKDLDKIKDERWNTKQMSSKLLQGLLNGDSIPKIANSLADIIGNNRASAYRNARTMVTGAENRGRLDSYKKLADQGVVQGKVWIATPDGRTRQTHLELDGEEVEINEEFSNGLMEPGDPDGDPAEVYNCRCGMRTHIIGFRRADGSISYVNYDRDPTSHSQKIDDEKERRKAEGKTKTGIKTATTQTQAKSNNILRDYDTDFAKYYGADYYNAMADLVDKCGNEDLKKVWELYQNKIGAKHPDHNGRAYESLGDVFVSKKSDMAGSSWKAPYSVTFHESGHAIDWITKDLANTNGLKFMYSSAYKDGLFPATIREEVAELVKKRDAELKALFKAHSTDYEWLNKNGLISDYKYNYYKRYNQWMGGPPKYSKSLAYGSIQKEVNEFSGMARADLSDMLEGATNGKIQCGFGHGTSYWSKRLGVDEPLGTEAFAEMTSATLTNPESLAVIKKYLPKSYSIYEDMLKELAGGV